MESDRRARTAGLFLILVMAAGAVHLASRANADLSSGRTVLFMDEIITFDGVRQILHPEGAREFLLAIVDGGDHRYGRILWNVSALSSAVPERLFGETGIIWCAGNRRRQGTL